MGCPTVKKAFEDSLKKSEVKNSDEFLVYDHGTVYSVTYGDIAVQLGVTGSLSSLGSGVQVLTGTAPNYQIRTIQGGNGVSAQQNISGGITLSANLRNAGNNADGQGIVVSTNVDPVSFRRLKAGAGISLTQTANNITIENTQATGGSASNLVVVSEVSDFPTPAAGVITLADNTEYQIIANIATSNRFVMGSNTVVSGVDPFVTELSYTGTDTMFTFTSGNSGFSDVALKAANGQLLDASSVVSGTLLFRFTRWAEVKDLGVLGHSNTAINNSFIVLHTGAGFSFGANVTDGRLNIDALTIASTTSATSTFVDLGTSIFDALSINNVSFLSTVLGQTFLSGVAGGGNIGGSKIGLVSRVTINGDMAALNGIANDDPGWDFTDNNKTQDTDPHAVLFLSAPASTTIVTAGTPVQVNGTFTQDDVQVYSTTAAGAANYLGRRPQFVRIDVTMSFEPASGTNKDIFAQIAVNGTPLTATKVIRTASAGSAAVVSIDWAATLSQNDSVTIMVGNDTDTIAVNVNQLLIRCA